MATTGLEASLLSAIVANPAWYWQVREHLPADAEVFTTLAATWQELSGALESGKPLPPIPVAAAPAPDPVGVARQLAEAYRRRRLERLAADALESLSQGRQAREVADDIEIELAQLQPLLTDRRLGPLAWGDTLLDQVESETWEASNDPSRSHSRGLPSGLATLDWLLDGWQPGGLYILGGAPGVGKTSLAVQCACEAVQGAGGLVVYFTYENSPQNLTLKAIGRLAGISTSTLGRGRAHPKRWKLGVDRFREVASRLAFVQADAGTSVAYVAARTREAMARAPAAPGLVIVDYLQRMAYGERFGTLDENVAALSLRLRDLAATLDAPVLAISSLASSDAAEDPLHLGVLARRGDLEYAADVVLLLGQRTHIGAASQSRARLMPGVTLLELLLAKNRYGEAGRTIPLLFRPATGDFQEEREV